MKILNFIFSQIILSVAQIAGGLYFLGKLNVLSHRGNPFPPIIGLLLIVAGALSLYKGIRDFFYGSPMLVTLNERTFVEVQKYLEGGEQEEAIRLIRAETGSEVADARAIVRSLKSRI